MLVFVLLVILRSRVEGDRDEMVEIVVCVCVCVCVCGVCVCMICRNIYINSHNSNASHTN